jgi:3-methyl-2-oxobutanoate hydroxymethyltransferase
MSSARLTVPDLQAMKREGRKIAALTAYDASFARVLDEAGVDLILVGDSLGMVVQGRQTTVPVSLDDMVYHCGCVSRGVGRALVAADLPFMSYPTPETAAAAAARLLQQGGAQMVKLEGGRNRSEVIRFLVDQNVPVCGHLGLLPQSIHRLGRYGVQGKDQASARLLQEDALILQEAGIGLLVLECVPAQLAESIRYELDIPVIGIGAGPACDGQVLVLHDLLGLTPGKPPRFVRNFMAGAAGIPDAVVRYVEAVRDGSFPAPEQCY